MSRSGEAGREYVAWGWAVNGFASVVGAALATILAMIFGFDVVLELGLGAYLLALLAWRRLAGPYPVGGGRRACLPDGSAGARPRPLPWRG